VLVSKSAADFGNLSPYDRMPPRTMSPQTVAAVKGSVVTSLQTKKGYLLLRLENSDQLPFVAYLILLEFSPQPPSVSHFLKWLILLLKGWAEWAEVGWCRMGRGGFGAKPTLLFSSLSFSELVVLRF